jgi:hypothetical protein
MVSRFATVALVLGAPACLPENDDDLSLVDSPRVLAVRASPAEALPDTSVAFESLFVDAAGTRTDAPIEWAFCIARKPLSELGPINAECRDPGSESRIPIGAGISASAALPTDACRLFGPQLPEPKAGEPAGRPVDPDSTGGFYQPLVLDVAEGPSSLTIFGSRLRCSLSGVTQSQSVAFERAYRPNENPSLESLRLAGGEPLPDATTGSVSVSPGSELQLEASWAVCPSTSECGDGLCTSGEDTTNCAQDCTTPVGCSGAERYSWFDPETRQLSEKREWIRVSWFVNHGKLAEERTGREEDDPATTSTNRWRAPSSGDTTLWIVLRDARGGVGFGSYRFVVE